MKAHFAALLRHVCHNPHSSFYRERLSAFRGSTLAHIPWSNVPCTTRDEIVATPFWQRTYVPRAEVPVIRNTYGSSGKRILITPRASYGDYTEPFLSTGYTRIMNFFASAHNDFPQHDTGLVSFFGDVGNLIVSAKIVECAQLDCLYITPYTALQMAELLSSEARSRIKAVQLTGERCSPLQYKKIKEWYPHATVFSNYASSETRETVAVSCVHDRAAGGSLVVGAVPCMYCEIIDVETGAVITEEGRHGELVITTLTTDIPFPLIRYRTGDIAVYTPRPHCMNPSCPRGFEVVGRKTVFPVRLVKGELTVNAVERALLDVPEVDTAYFEIHYFEEDAGKNVLPRVHLVLVAPRAQKERVESCVARVASALHVFPTYTYADGVRDGYYLPLSIATIETAPPAPLGKPRAPVVVRHVRGAAGDSLQSGPAHDARS